MPVMKAMPTAEEKPMPVKDQRPSRLRRATPRTSIIRPVKYLERRYSMSEIASMTRLSISSGTKADTILPKRDESLMKKKDMKTTEKIPTPMETRNEATCSTADEIEDVLSILARNLPTTASIRKSGPRLLKCSIIQEFMSATKILKESTGRE